MQAMNTEKRYNFGQKAQTALRPEQRPTSQPQAPQTRAPKGQGPLKSFKSGAIQVTIWANENLNAEGQVMAYQTVSFERRYKDKNGEWKSTNSLRANDLPKATLLLSKAYEYLVLTGEDGGDADGAYA